MMTIWEWISFVPMFGGVYLAIQYIYKGYPFYIWFWPFMTAIQSLNYIIK